MFVGDVEMVTSEVALAEFERVLGYDHLPFSPTEQERFPELLRREATVVNPTVNVEAVDDDSDDDVFLRCAVAGDVTHLVSGDSHLTDLGSYDGIPILEPATFLSELEDRFGER